MKNNQIFLRISFTRKDYCNNNNQILIPYNENVKKNIVPQIEDFFAKEWIIKDDRSKWIYHRPENDGPACEYANGYKEYYLNGERHRENGPAFEDANGNKEYYLNGKLHNENGHAIEYANGYKVYYLNGKHFKNKSQYLKALKGLKQEGEQQIEIKNQEQVFVRISFTEEDYLDETNQVIIPYDESLKDDISQIKNFYSKEWIIFLKDDRSEWIWHRPENDGPAIEYVDGHKTYWLNGKRHRENGPAIEWASGDKEYYLNGKIHRENGPAIEYTDSDEEYWLNDIYFKNEFEYLKALEELKQ